ncbi:alcohol dehydrogenase catalytic domain-containing protein [Streptomyces sp. NPDC007088]|uniref:alcohol dehydrogenase catalytic domain-containing protein n=1 Tax=Streptomyces sp. NPDC007088 TaxID=3364773 RepID=UPI0036C4E05F
MATAWGGAEVIGLTDVPAVPPGPGEVVVAVRATAVSPFDVKRAQGLLGRDPGALPLRLGNEMAGVVTAVGPGPVSFEGERLAVGDEVLGHWLPGAQAEQLTVPARVLLRKPPRLGFPEAAALLGSGTTATHALEAVGAGEGDVVLLHGAGGAVGGMVAQLALLCGAQVIGTASAARHARLRASGVTPVAYGEGLEERVRALAPGGVTAAVDTAGTDEALSVSLALVPEPGRVVTMVNYAAAQAAGARTIGPGGETERVRPAARPGLVRQAAAGELTVEIEAAFPLEEARSAYALQAGGHAGGRIVLLP